MGKKHREYDFDMDDQQAMLDRIDAFIGGEADSASFAEEPEEKDNDEWMDSIGSMLGFTTPKDETKESAIDAIINAPVDTSNFKPSFDASEDDEEEEDVKKNEKFFSITWDEENSIVSFSDEIRIYDIDLKTLTRDDDVRYTERNSSKEDFVDNVRRDFSETIYNILTCFYPKAIFTKSKLLDAVKHITEIDETRFMFFEHPAKKNVVLGYEILDVSWEEADEVISKAIERGCAISLLVAMETIFNADGVSFRNADSDTLDSLMVNKDYKENQDYMIENIYESRDTKVDKSIMNESLSDVIEIGSFLGSEPVYKSVADTLKDNIPTTTVEKIQVSSLYGEIRNPNMVEENTVERHKDEMTKLQQDAFYNMPSTYGSIGTPEEDESDEVVTEEVAEIMHIEVQEETETVELPEDEPVDEVVEVPEIEDDEVSEIDLPEDEEMDHDEAEELYFGSKKPRTSMKSSKSFNDDEFVVTRRK